MQFRINIARESDQRQMTSDTFSGVLALAPVEFKNALTCIFVSFPNQPQLSKESTRHAPKITFRSMHNCSERPQSLNFNSQSATTIALACPDYMLLKSKKKV